jgi:hypothetical protein
MKFARITFIKLIVLFSVTVSAAIPTTEGLFRNGNNADVSATLVTARFLITRDLSELIMEKTSEDSPANESELLQQRPTPLYVKYNFSIDKYDRVQVIQSIYSNGKMKKESLLDVRYISNLKDKIKKSPKRKAIFYALISSFVLNRSTEMSEFLKLKSKDFKTNKELLDPEKKALYEKYKRYLAVTKEDKSLLESMDNPMNPTDPEAQKAVSLLKDRPFMQKDPSVSLQKTSSGFYWNVSLDVLNASFDSENFRLEKLSFGEIEKSLKFSFSDYILFDGTHELPKHIKIKSIDEIVSIRSLSLRHRNLGSKSMSQKYREILKDLPKKNEDTPQWESFLIQ